MLMVALAAGAFLRFYDLGALEMSADEGASWGAASAPTVAEVVARQQALNLGKLPIHDLMLHGWINIFGSSLPAMRAMSGALGVISILLVYLVAIEMFSSDESAEQTLDRDQIKLVAALSAIVFAVSLIAIKYAREARMYPLMLAVVLTQVGMFLHSLRRGSLVNYFLLAILTTFAVGSHFSAVLMPATEGLWLIGLIIKHGWRPRSDRTRRAWCVAMALGAGGCLLVPALLSSFRAAAPSASSNILKWIKPPPFYALFALFNKATGSFAFPVLALLAIWGAVRGWRRGTRNAIAFALLWMWAPPIIMMIASYTLTPIFVERYALSCFVPFFILVAIGIIELPGQLYRASTLAIVIALSLGHIHSYQRKAHDAPYREAVAAADVALNPGEVMTVVPAYAIEVLRYYLPPEHVERAVRHDPKSQTPAVLIIADQNLARGAVEKYMRDYPRVVTRLRGIEVWKK